MSRQNWEGEAAQTSIFSSGSFYYHLAISKNWLYVPHVIPHIPKNNHFDEESYGKFKKHIHLLFVTAPENHEEASFKRDRCVIAYTHVCNEEFVQRCIRSCKAEPFHSSLPAVSPCQA